MYMHLDGMLKFKKVINAFKFAVDCFRTAAWDVDLLEFMHLRVLEGVQTSPINCPVCIEPCLHLLLYLCIMNEFSTYTASVLTTAPSSTPVPQPSDANYCLLPS